MIKYFFGSLIGKKHEVFKELEELVRKHILFHGTVQGVGFRYRAMYLARGLELTGWVANLDDGRVEMEVQGEEDNIEYLLEQLKQAPGIIITEFFITDLAVKQEKTFKVRE